MILGTECLSQPAFVPTQAAAMPKLLAALRAGMRIFCPQTVTRDENSSTCRGIQDLPKELSSLLLQVKLV